HPIVQGTGHGRAMHDALAERSALVRTMVVDGVDLIVGGTEDSDFPLGRGDAAGAAARDLGDGANCDPIHDCHSAACAKPTEAIGRNSCLSLPDTRSDHGSTWANFWLKTKRS